MKKLIVAFGILLFWINTFAQSELWDIDVSLTNETVTIWWITYHEWESLSATVLNNAYGYLWIEYSLPKTIEILWEPEYLISWEVVIPWNYFEWGGTSSEQLNSNTIYFVDWKYNYILQPGNWGFRSNEESSFKEEGSVIIIGDKFFDDKTISLNAAAGSNYLRIGNWYIKTSFIDNINLSFWFGLDSYQTAHPWKISILNSKYTTTVKTHLNWVIKNSYVNWDIRGAYTNSTILNSFLNTEECFFWEGLVKNSYITSCTRWYLPTVVSSYIFNVDKTSIVSIKDSVVFNNNSIEIKKYAEWNAFYNNNMFSLNSSSYSKNNLIFNNLETKAYFKKNDHSYYGFWSCDFQWYGNFVPKKIEKSYFSCSNWDTTTFEQDILNTHTTSFPYCFWTNFIWNKESEKCIDTFYTDMIATPTF